MFRSNLARKSAKADARVAALTEESTQLQLRRSQAETALAQFEAQRLRADLEALHAQYVALERDVRVVGPRPA
jgi:hypothetical protein